MSNLSPEKPLTAQNELELVLKRGKKRDFCFYLPVYRMKMSDSLKRFARKVVRTGILK